MSGDSLYFAYQHGTYHHGTSTMITMISSQKIMMCQGDYTKIAANFKSDEICKFWDK